MSSQREIWFQCEQCRRESYCGSEFEELADPNVFCPFCRHVMPLEEARLDRRLRGRTQRTGEAKK